MKVLVLFQIFFTLLSSQPNEAALVKFWKSQRNPQQFVQVSQSSSTQQATPKSSKSSQPANKVSNQKPLPTPSYKEGKYIEVDISDQRLYCWENGQLVGNFLVSTGKPSMPTPLGQFSILSKSRLAYSKRYRLYMPYWNQFTTAGHGIHELPYWPGGRREGSNHLGRRVSHGCIRLGIGPAEFVYNWAPVGTPVIIHR